MRHVHRFRIMAALAVLSGGMAGGAWAGDVVTDDIQRAYGPYRVALFKTNSQSQADAEQALAQLQAAWQQVVEAHAAKPAAPYDRDVRFGQTLKEVSEVFAKAAREVADLRLKEAHETLEDARELLADMRRRNQVVVFSDHINAYHAEMEHVLLQGGKTLSSKQGMQKMTAQAGVLTYLATRLRAEAPPVFLNNPEFENLMQRLEASTSHLMEATLSQDEDAVRKAIGQLKVPFSKLFLKFG